MMRGLFKQTNPDKPLGGRYKIISELGAGGFGHTFLADDLHLPDHPRCVVKQLKPQLNDAETLQTARRLFDIEARVLSQLGNHDQIPRLLAHFEENQEFYLAQELIEGQPLTKELTGGQIWSEAQVIAFLQDLLSVLAFVHQQNVIHRDIKPSNLIRRRDGRIVLIDFGAVKQVSTQIVNPKSENTKTISIGTQGYTPKEQLGGNPRFSSDVYAVGIIGIQALTGTHPRHLSENSQTGEIEWRDRASHVSPEFADILDCMVRYDFRVRYPTAAEALEALGSLPIANLESLRSPQQVSEATAQATEEPTRQAPPPPLTSTSSTALETEQAPTNIWVPTQSPRVEPHSSTQPTGAGTEQAPTNIWVPTEPPVEAHPTAKNTGSTAPPPQLQHSQPSGIGAPTVTTPSSVQRQSVKLWSVLAVLGTVGATFLITKTFLYPQLAGKTDPSTVVSTESPTTSSAEKPTPPTPVSLATESPTPSSGEKPAPPTSATPAVESPNPSSGEKPAPPTSATPTVESPTPSSSEKPAPPSPARLPATTQAVNPPAPSPVKSAPLSPAPSPVKSAPLSPAPSPVKSAPAPQEPTVTEVLSQADRLREAGQYQTAVDLYDKAIAQKPDIAEAHWGRCYSLNSLQQPAEAIAACNQALALKPNYPEALWSKGNALDQQQRFTDSLPLYEQATALKPNFAEAWNNKGVALLALDRASEAVDAFNKATALKPNFADAWANRGAALWKLRRPRQAIASLEKALRIQPDNPTAINLRQQVREKLRR